MQLLNIYADLVESDVEGEGGGKRLGKRLEVCGKILWSWNIIIVH